jgi:hypothetical protein
MRGGKRAPHRFVDWQTFFDFGDGNARPNKMIDTKLSSVLMHLLGSRGPSPGMPSDGVLSLASRKLSDGKSWMETCPPVGHTRRVLDDGPTEIFWGCSAIKLIGNAKDGA